MATKEENIDKDDHTRSLSPGVKSTAVVKYTSVQCPVEFAKLQCNTDLKMPPSNWLSSAADSYGLRHALSQSAGFSSFRMAHMFPDCVGEVDVVSGAECIKTLLKLPYHPNGTISMIVHRVENTLLLDDFDIYRYLMKTEWSWMKGFFYDNVLKSLRGKDKIMHVQNRSRNALQQKSLVSKFLYHSLIQSSQDIDLETQNELPSLPSAGPNLPDPDMKENIPDPNHSNHTYNRNVVWTFEDIQMLIGSDMPIFGGEDRPCVSLRLRDASQPINVLTGIDYWLDNLMCNVPEVVMCYHLDGIVQKYEPIKTEDLPHLEDSKFSPKVIRNVAQNILSFLKSNATKAGHTYWLFKGTHDDVVKLYDLSTLCGTASENASDQNPFTVPVAMLLYRVARNMKPPCQAGHIRLLLENCIKLLPIERYPQIVASSHYMLADLYLPADTDPGNPNFKETSVECECGDAATCRRREVDDDENSATISYGEKAARDRNEDLQGHFIREDGKDPQMTSDTDSGDYLNMDNQEISERVAVNSLMAPRPPLPSPKSTPPAVHGPVEERCLFALEHVKQGLEALKLFPDYSNEEATDDKNQYETENQQEEILKEEENPKMARPFQPIPMNYEPLNAQEEQFKMAKPTVPIPLSYRHHDEKTNTPNIEKNTSIEKQQDRSSRRRKKEMKGKKKHLSESEIDSSNKKVLKRDIENLIKKTANVVLRKESNLPTWQEPNRSDDISWKIHLKTLLYEKACLSYATLSEQHYMDCQYGMSFKYIILAQKFQVVLSKTLHNSRAVDDSCLLGRAGDNFFQFAKNWDKYESLYSKQIEARSDEEKWIMEEVSKDLELYWEKNKRVSSVAVSDITPPIDLETSMIASCEFYNQALKVVPNDRREELMRRIASVKNELGVKYMYSAQEQYTLYCNEAEKNKTDIKKNEEQEDPLYEIYSKKSIACLTESAKIFEDVKDAPNLALLHCNTGRFLRFRAHCNKSNNSPEQRHLYSLAVELYGKALRLLIGLNCDSVRDLVKWELSSALFTQACLLQDFPPDNCDAASEAINALCLALRNCPLTGGPRHCLYQFRAAVLHHRLASLYHSQYRETSSDVSRKKSTVAMSKINYEQAVKHLLPLEDTNMFLTVQMEHVALLEYQANNSPGLKLKSLQNALGLLQQCEPIIKLVSDKDTYSGGNSILSESKGSSAIGDSLNKNEFTEDLNNTESNERIQKDPDRNEKEIKKQSDSDEDLEIMESEFKLLSLFQQRLQFILKSLIQLCLQKQSGMSKKDCDKMSSFYKVLYSYTLKVGKFNSNECKIFARHLMDVLINMKTYSNSNDTQLF